MPKTIHKDTPLSEITLRRYEKPGDAEDRELVKKLCLSIGLLQPGDSRDVVVDILHTIVKEKKPLTCPEIEKSVVLNREKYNLPAYGIASSNIRRQLRRIKDVFLIQETANKYHLTENLHPKDIFEEKIKKYYLDSILNRVGEYFEALK